jgi:hypothetical protein
MFSISNIVILVVIVFLPSCRKNEPHINRENLKFTDDSVKNKNVYDTKKILDEVVPETKLAEEIKDNSQTQEENTKHVETNEPIKKLGGIVAEKRNISPEDAYIKFLSDGLVSAPKLLTNDDLRLINAKKIKSATIGKEQHLTTGDKKVINATHAYARTLNFPLGVSPDVECLGVYEEADCFMVFFGLSSQPLNNYDYVYVVLKDNGRFTIMSKP